jgi:hypothetical protein
VTYDLPNPFLFLSPLSAGNAAPATSAPGLTAGAAPGYPCCTDCGMCDPCDDHCPNAAEEIIRASHIVYAHDPRFKLDPEAFMAEVEPVPAFLTDNRAQQIEELLELARAEEWPAPPRRMVG